MVAGLLQRRDMTTIELIHRANMAILVDECGGTTALGDKIGVSASQISQWLNGSINSGTGKPRGMHPNSCRKLEGACGKPVGWMDKSHAPDDAGANALGGADAQVENVVSDKPAVNSNLQQALLDQAKLLTLFWSADDIGRSNILDYAQGEVVHRSNAPAMKAARDNA